MPQLFGFVTLSWKFVHIVQHLKWLVRKLWISVVWGKKKHNTALPYTEKFSQHVFSTNATNFEAVYTAPTTLNIHRKRTLCFCCLSHKQNCFILSWAFFTALWRTVIFLYHKCTCCKQTVPCPCFLWKNHKCFILKRTFLTMFYL